MNGDDKTRIPATVAAVRRGFASGLTAYAQLYVSRGGEVIADWAEGATHDGAEVSTTTPSPWLSAGKPITAVAIAQLWERGKLELDDRVAAHIPEFGVNGKELITVRHILTHTAGFRAMPGDFENQPWEKIIAAVCDARLEPRWIIGQTAGYHVATSWYILAELMRRLDGRSIDQYAREMIFDPIGMAHCSFGEHVRPGASAIGPARELGLFYEALRDRGSSILRPQTVEAITARHRTGLLDKTFRHVMDWGLGFIVQSNQYGYETLPYSFGPYASPRTFGHGGARSSIAFCDPENALVVAIVLSRANSESEHHARMLEIHRALDEDLGLAR